MERMLTLDNVSVGYGRQVVIRGISASLKHGELVCLLGRNGIGKSTLLRSIASFQPLLDGDIRLDARSLGSFERKELAKIIGIVLTERNILADMTIKELVSLGRSPYTGFFGNLSKEDIRIVDEAVELVGISSIAERKLNSLSDGERQKAMIARTLAQQTQIILLDEPTAFLDFQSRIELFELLRSLAWKEHKTIFMTTHDVHLAFKMSDKLWLLNRDYHGETKLSIHASPVPEEVIKKFVCIENTNLFNSNL